MELSRTSGSVASGLVLYFEWTKDDALMRVGTFPQNVKAQMMPITFQESAKIGLSGKSRVSKRAALLRKQRDDDSGIVGEDVSICPAEWPHSPSNSYKTHLALKY